MLCFVVVVPMLSQVIAADTTTAEIQFLNELTVDKLIHLKNSLKDFVTEYDNVTVTTPHYIDNFGAQAMAFKAPLTKRIDYENLYKKGGYSKISNIFSMSVTTLAFLAFGGYLLCLIVQAVKSKQNTIVTTPTPTLFFNSGIKRPQTTFSSYGRQKRDKRELQNMYVPPEELFSALLQLCEGYAKWSRGDKEL